MPHIPGEVVPVESKPWQTGLAPVYIGLFLWVAFFDQLGRRTLPTAGLGWPLLGALAAGPLAYLLLFRVPALWGQATGRSLAIVATATFGSTGAKLVPGLLIGMSQVVWFAVAVGYAVDLTFRGLELGQFVDPRALAPMAIGEAILPSPLFLATALFWCVASALVGGWFVRWIAALMQVFPIFPAVALAGAMLAMLVGVRSFEPSGVDGLTGAVVQDGAGFRAFLLTIQAIFAFTAMAGVTAADWGSASLGPRDVTRGGWVGVGFAPVVVAALALVAVAGYQGKALDQEAEARSRPAPGRAVSTIAEAPGRVGDEAVMGRGVPAFTFRALLVGGFDRRVGCPLLLVFGLASLAPACYAAFEYGHRFAAIGSGVGRLTWTVLGALAAWFLIVGGWHERTDAVFGTLGALFAPVAGAMAADYSRHRGEWPGARRGINPPGLVAWSIGLVLGLVPLVGRAFGVAALERFQPASVWAFATAYGAYWMMARAGFESGRDLTMKTAPTPEPTETA